MLLCNLDNQEHHLEEFECKSLFFQPSRKSAIIAISPKVGGKGGGDDPDTKVDIQSCISCHLFDDTRFNITGNDSIIFGDGVTDREDKEWPGR